MFEEAQTACNKFAAAEGYPTIPGVREKWRLPKPEEFAHIGREDQHFMNDILQTNVVGNDMYKILPNMEDHFFWSSSSAGLGKDYAWGFDSGVGYVLEGGPRSSNDASVRCVAR